MESKKQTLEGKKPNMKKITTNVKTIAAPIAVQTSVRSNKNINGIERNGMEWNEHIECSNVSIATNKLKGDAAREARTSDAASKANVASNQRQNIPNVVSIHTY